MVSFDTNVLIYATAAVADQRVGRARDLLARALQAANCVLLLQSLTEFSNVAIRKAGIPVEAVQRIVQAWCAVLPVQAAEDSDLFTALDAVRTHRLTFWDAMLWASAQRTGVRHLLTEDFQDGFVLQDVTFINPFIREKRSADRKASAATLTGSCGSDRTRAGSMASRMRDQIGFAS